MASEIDQLLQGLSDYGFGGLDRVAVLRAVLAAAERDIYDTDWTNVVEDGKQGIDLREPLLACEKALVKAVDFLRREGVTSDRLLPYALQIVLLSEFFRNCSDPSRKMEKELRRWFWVTSFTGWYASFNSSRTKTAIDEMRGLARGQRTRIETVKVETALPFPSRFDARSARVRSFLLYLMSLGPRSLDTGDLLNAGELLSALGPQALRYIQARSLPKDLHSSPANRILLGPAHRGQASKALQEIPSCPRTEILASHGIPDDSICLLEPDDLKDFVRARLKYLIEGEREFMKQRQVEPSSDRDPVEPEIDTEGADD